MRHGLILLVATWSLVVTIGLGAVWNYSGTPGNSGEPVPSWPPQSAVDRDGRPTLLLFAHPFCPCTRASLAELARLLAVCGERVDAHVLFVAPRGTDQSWLSSDLYAQARRIHGVTLHVDSERLESRLFGAGTSGECRLYDPRGRLVFHGGITASRAHEGDNYGRRTIQALLAGQAPVIESTDVYGCPLFEPESKRNEDGSLR